MRLGFRCWMGWGLDNYFNTLPTEISYSRIKVLKIGSIRYTKDSRTSIRGKRLPGGMLPWWEGWFVYRGVGYARYRYYVK